MKVLKIGAVWCSGCLVMSPRWKEIESANPQLKTEYFDYDDSPEIVKKYNLNEGKLPTFIFLDDAGNELSQFSGEISKEKLLEKINEFENA